MENNIEKSYSQEELQLLEIFMLNSFDGIFIVDKKGKLLFINPAIERMLNTEKHKLVGKQVGELIKNGIYEGSPALESLEKKKAYTGLVKTRAGLEIISTSKPIFNENGEVELIVTNCRPLIPLKEFLNSYEDGKIIQKYDEPSHMYTEFIYRSGIMKALINKAERIAKSDSAVIIFGETGSGKGLLSGYIHGNSYRNKSNLVEINCAAIPEHLIESELFGYEKGAFTGASAGGKLGLFEIADGGTIFLDEIGEMPLLLQAKLLKVLDAGYIIRVGGTVSHKTNARVIVATNKDLKSLVKCGKFREDLYYRLNVLPIRMPSLRERKEDIPLLIDFILNNLNSKYVEKKYFSEKDRSLIENYDWPGNVRQLRNVIERLYILSENEMINVEEDLIFNDDDLYDIAKEEEDGIEQSDLKSFLKSVEQKHIKRTLDMCGGNVSMAADKLGVHRTALYKKIKTMA